MEAILGLLVALSYFRVTLGGCVFGPDNLAQLTTRNNTILSIMNETLFNYSNAAEIAITRNSNFSLGTYLSRTYAIDLANYLTFVSMGKLLKINWTQATKSATLNNTFDGLMLDSYISKGFVQPVHAALQNLSDIFSFSIGIFRPNETQFYYTGFTTDSAGNAILDSTCYAGVAFLWRFSTNLYFNMTFFDHLSPEYANLAMTMEKGLDSYYRTKTALGDNFVRMNMKNATKWTDGTARAIVYIEAYFRNRSYDEKLIVSSTVLTNLNINYQEEGSSSSTLITYNAQNATRISSVSYAPSTSSTVSTLQTTIFQSTLTSTASTPYNTSNSLNTESTSTLVSSTLTTQNTSTSLTTASMSNLTMTLINSLSSTTTSYNASFTSQDTMFPTQTLTANTNYETPNAVASTNWSSQTTQTSSFNLPNTINTSATINPININSTSYGLNISTTINSWSGHVTPSNGNMLTALAVPHTTITAPKPNFSANTSDSYTTPNTSTGGYNNDGGTTYDADPFFRAQVPVVTKVYNDGYLLRMKFGTMKPLMQNKDFFMVTIPALVGMLVSLVCCLICWQRDCFPQDQKMRTL